MQIKITTTLDISPENLGLIPLIIASLSYDSWSAEQLSLDEGADVTPNTFIRYWLAKDARQRLTNIIAPQVDSYFGGVMKAKAEAVKGQLATAIKSVVEITD